MRNTQLLEYIDQFQNLVIDSEIIAIKDIDSEYCFASHKWLKCFGLNQLQQIQGKKDRDILALPQHFIEAMELLDQECLNLKKQILAHALINVPNFGPRLFIVQKSLIVKDGKAIGIRDFYQLFITREYMYNLLTGITEDIPKGEIETAPELTDREQAILFLLLVGYTPKLIAWVLQNYTNKSICGKTISNIIYQQLYPKFKVDSLASLTKTALCLEVNQKIPHIFKNYSFIVKIS